MSERVTLTQDQRDAIDVSLIDVKRAAWEHGLECDDRLLRMAYMTGRVDQKTGRPLPGVRTSSTHTTSGRSR